MRWLLLSHGIPRAASTGGTLSTSDSDLYRTLPRELFRGFFVADEELEIRAKRASPEERGRKPHPFPGSTPQNPVISQTPPMPGHRSQAPTPRPGPPGPRVQHPQKKRPPPTPGTQVHQQKGPPLPKPRVQTKPTHEAKENS